MDLEGKKYHCNFKVVKNLPLWKNIINKSVGEPLSNWLKRVLTPERIKPAGLPKLMMTCQFDWNFFSCPFHPMAFATYIKLFLVEEFFIILRQRRDRIRARWTLVLLFFVGWVGCGKMDEGQDLNIPPPPLQSVKAFDGCQIFKKNLRGIQRRQKERKGQFGDQPFR